MLAWPGERPGGLLGAFGARVIWAVLWLAMAWLWLASNQSANATRNAIAGAPSGVGWLGSVQHVVARAASGHGAGIAIVMASLSVTIGLSVALGWQAKLFLFLAIILNLGYWVIGQGFGGILTETATDPNTAPLVVLLAIALFPLVDTALWERMPSRRLSSYRAVPRTDP